MAVARHRHRPHGLAKLGIGSGGVAMRLDVRVNRFAAFGGLRRS
jgi:hypothetical protein